MKLIIGNKNYSSWSLRPWFLLSAHNIAFEEIRIPLYTENTYIEFAKYTEAGKVPVLHDKDLIVWDSLAICEYISELYLNGKGWPADAGERAEARSCCAEMHSGFFAIRQKLPMNCRAVNRKIPLPPDLEEEISRIDTLWSSLRARHKQRGPWLFGDFTIVDCMFAPVVFRFTTYDIDVSTSCQKYMEKLLAHPKIQMWLAAAQKEVETIEQEEVGL